jgi:hypothetical protein
MRNLLERQTLRFHWQPFRQRAISHHVLAVRIISLSQNTALESLPQFLKGSTFRGKRPPPNYIR